jgi:L-serine deaminase
LIWAAIGVTLTCSLGLVAAPIAAQTNTAAITINCAGAVVPHADANDVAGHIAEDLAGADLHA